MMETKTEVIFSYSPKDETLKKELEKHLNILKIQGLITAWHPHKIKPGGDWSHEIDQHLNTAQIILLLVSPDFLTTDFLYSNQIKLALERQKAGEAQVIPIILRPADWERTPLGKLSPLPSNAKPVTKWINHDLAFIDIAREIRKMIENLHSRQPKSEPKQVSDFSNEASKNKRLADLERKLRKSHTLIQDCECISSTSEDPQEISQAQQSLERHWKVVKNFLGEYLALADQLGVSVPTDILQISTYFGTENIKNDSLAIQKALNTFSPNELRLLCFDIGIDVDIFRDENLEANVIALLDYMKQRSQMEELAEYVHRMRPTYSQ